MEQDEILIEFQQIFLLTKHLGLSLGEIGLMADYEKDFLVKQIRLKLDNNNSTKK